jgi:predicted regulator of Ras-like GTPase activity (Roadblock/LC7/MglB family)
MQTVLSQLNSVPGVIGSMACDKAGRVLAQAFPPLFDGALLQDAARVLADGSVGLDLANEGAELLDFRYAEARLSVKTFPGALLLVLSGRTTNLQFLNLSLSLAAAKLTKLQAPAAPPPAAAAPADAVGPAAGGDKDRARRARRVAAPTRGLEELRRRLGAAKGPDEERPEADSGSFKLPVGAPAEVQLEAARKTEPK